MMETEWLFGTPAGRRQLQASAGCARLAVVVLRRGHHFESLDAVKEELAHTAKMLIPYGFSGQIPFLSLGSAVGSRTRVSGGHSSLSGPYEVEDVEVEGALYRRLIFLDNQFLVQSEALLKTVTKKGKPKQVIDFGHISPYQTFMCVGAALVRADVTRARTCVLGLGGGGLCMFLNKCFRNMEVTAIELDPEMLVVAREHFELQLDDRLTAHIKDGADFLREEAETDRKYEVVMFDMDSKDRSLGLSCPPPQFLEHHMLELVKRILGDDGHFILNLVCRDAQLQGSLVNNLRKSFKHLVSVKLCEDVNDVILATNSGPYSIQLLEKTAKSLNTTARQTNLVKIKCVDLKDFMQSVSIIS